MISEHDSLSVDDPSLDSSYIQVDLDKVAKNLQTMKRAAGDAQVMAILKANAYGHGLLPIAEQAATEVSWLGVAQAKEALALREQLDVLGYAKDEPRVFTWLTPFHADWAALINAGIDVAASSAETVRAIAKAARESGQQARVHLKVDVGMSRGGALGDGWVRLVEAAKVGMDEGDLVVVGIWSHLPGADDQSQEGLADAAEQITRFEEAVRVAQELGVEPQFRHLAATGATLWLPEAHFDMVRVGIGMYGLSPNPSVASSAELGLEPALSLFSQLVLVKQLPVGRGVSYSSTWRADVPTWVGVVPLGYADGIPRHASNACPVVVGGQASPEDAPAMASRILGRVCMDQFVISLGEGEEPAAPAGTQVTLIGSGPAPTADEWAQGADTINYEIVTRLAAHLPRRYVGGLSERVER